MAEQALTRRASEFARKNRSARIVSGAWLDKDRRSATGAPETWVRLRYRFDDGSQITLTEADMASMKAREIVPVWINDPSPKATAAGGNGA